MKIRKSKNNNKNDDDNIWYVHTHVHIHRHRQPVPQLKQHAIFFHCFAVILNDLTLDEGNYYQLQQQQQQWEEISWLNGEFDDGVSEFSFITKLKLPDFRFDRVDVDEKMVINTMICMPWCENKVWNRSTYVGIENSLF